MNINRKTLKLALNSRAALFAAVVSAALGGILTIGQAWDLSQVVNRVFLAGQTLGEIQSILIRLLFIIVSRALLAWTAEVSARSAAIQVKHDLRKQLFAHILALGPANTRRKRTGELTNAAVEGIEALDAYFSQYLPQLAVSFIIPISILIFVFPIDPLSGLILVLTAPLIPIFMVLIGKAAETLTNRQYETLSRLSAHFLDSLQGLTTLKMFGRSKSHAETITKAGDQYRQVTMRVLRVTFLSALVLELLATLSTAVIAVEVGLRLLYARMSFQEAFFLLILAPEFYIPLRMLGLRFHAGMNGTSAARKIFAILDIPIEKRWVNDSHLRVSPPRAALLKEQESPELIPFRLSLRTERSVVRHSPPLMETFLVVDKNPDTPHDLILDSHQPPEISFESVSFTYPGEPAPTIKDLSLVLKPGTHTALVGASGAGKSTLAQMLLGFFSPDQGQILINGQPLDQVPIHAWRDLVAWVPQNPFIFNRSLADNIRLGQPDAPISAVQEAAQAAHLHSFITHLPEGYDTLAGEGGSHLSAGQAQRVALARAFLLDAPILIFDEPTSHLDPILEDQLSDSTRVLITRSGGQRTILTIAHRLNTISKADRVILLGDGQILGVGTHHDLLSENEVYARMFQVQSKSNLSETGSYTGDHNTQVSPGGTEESFPEIPNATIPPTHPSTNPFFRLLTFLKGSWGRVALSVLAGTGTVLSSLGLIGTSAWLISAAALHPSIAELQVAIVGVRTFGISRGALRYLERLISHDVTFRLLARLRSWFYQAIEPLAPARLTRYHSGDLLSRVIADVENLENYYVRVASPLIVAFLVSFGASVYLGIYDPRLGGVLLVFLTAVGAGVPALIRSLSQKPGRELVACRARLHTHLVEGIQGMADLLASGRADDLQDQIEKIGQDYGVTQRRMAFISGLHSGLSLLLTHLGTLLVLVLGIMAVTAGTIPALMLGALTLIALVSFEAVQPLPLAAQMLESTTESARRLFELLDAVPEVLESGGHEKPADFPARITFKDLTFTYPGSQRPALRKINFELPENGLTAVVGPSGAGKSTLLNLLMRFWDYANGEIRYGGRPLAEYPPDDLRTRIAVVPQRSYFFNTSLAENLRIARPAATPSELAIAARQARIHTWITSLPQGYDTVIGEQGVRLSGGERQRLAIARALLKRAPILILDEPTANLDPLTESALMDTLLSVTGRENRAQFPRSILLITHRLIGLEKADEIIVLDQGQIVQRGTQAQLLGSPGLYAKMYQIQNRIISH